MATGVMVLPKDGVASKENTYWTSVFMLCTMILPVFELVRYHLVLLLVYINFSPPRSPHRDGEPCIIIQ
jgi:hypothetical protein